MRIRPQTSAMRTARFLNIALNIVIAILCAALLGMLILPFLGQDVINAMESQNGHAPSLPGLNSGVFGLAFIAAAYLYVAFVVKKIVRTTINGNPFVTENISRLRKTWIVIALVELLRGGVQFIFGNDIAISLNAWFLVFIVAIMAEVFRIGLELRRDQELTV